MMFIFSQHVPFIEYGRWYEKKTGKVLILIQFLPFFIRNPLMDRFSHLDLVA